MCACPDEKKKRINDQVEPFIDVYFSDLIMTLPSKFENTPSHSLCPKVFYEFSF